MNFLPFWVMKYTPVMSEPMITIAWSAFYLIVYMPYSCTGRTCSSTKYLAKIVIRVITSKLSFIGDMALRSLNLD